MMTKRRRKMDTPSQRMKIFLITTGVWLLVVCAGIVLYEGKPDSSVFLPLMWYDSVIKKIGPLLPWAAFFIRVSAVLFKANRQYPTRPHLYEVSLVYLMIATLRIVLYMLHLSIQQRSISEKMPSWLEGHIMSDHILLGASIICTLQIEGIFLWRELPRSRGEYQKVSGEAGSAGGWSRLLLGSSLILGIVLFVLTCGDMFYTAKYFHPKFQSLMALGLGLVVFQVPSMIWSQKRM